MRGGGRHQLAQMLVIGLIASVIGTVGALAVDWFPPAASEQAHKIDDLYDVLLIASVPVFVLVIVIVLYSVWKFRVKPGQELQDGPPIHGNTRLEVIWTAIPAIMMVGLSTYAYAVLRDIEHNHGHDLQVGVKAQQFIWEYDYSAPGGKKVTSHTLYLPEGREVHFNIKSVDVIHSFWLQNMRLKIDAVPGITTHYRITPNRLGTYPVVCAELCGAGHSTMRSFAKVVTQGQFNTWLRKMSGAATAGGGGAKAGGAAATSPAAGKQVFTGAGGCNACHTLADANAKGTTGPNLDKVLKGKPKSFILQSILKPNAFIAKGYPASVMPKDFGQKLSKQQITALVNYISSVTK